MANNQDFAKLLEKQEFNIPQVGDIITGKVISATGSEVKLDIDGTMTGVVRGRELYPEADEYADLKPGDTIEATVIEGENENGELELSFRHAGQQKAWANLTDSFENGTIIPIKAYDANRGGLMVRYMQISGFLPVSQLSPENYPRVSGGDKSKILEKLRELVGQELEVKVINLDRKDDKLIVSEKEAWQERQQDVLNKYNVGDVVEGEITAITNFGIFITFGENLEGLIHISELAWQRIDDPNDLYKVGEMIKAQIINIEGSKIFLSAKKLMKDPWENIEDRYQVGKTYTGKILKVNPFGLFVELDEDIHGLAHVSQLSLAPGQKIDQKYRENQELEFEVMSIEPDEHRLGLAVKSEPKPKDDTESADEDKTEADKDQNTAEDKTEETKKEDKSEEK